MRIASSALPLALAVLAVSACGSPESSTVTPVATETTTSRSETVPLPVPAAAVAVPEDVAFWSEFAIDANWLESYPTVRETTNAADFAVIANVRSVVPTEAIGATHRAEKSPSSPGDGSGHRHLRFRLKGSLCNEGGPLDRPVRAWADDGYPLPTDRLLRPSHEHCRIHHQ